MASNSSVPGLPVFLAIFLLAPALGATALQTTTSGEPAAAMPPARVDDACVVAIDVCGNINFPLFVEEAGDTMTGDLGFAEGRGLAWGGNRLLVVGGLEYNGARVCLGSGAGGCVTSVSGAEGSGLDIQRVGGDLTINTDPSVLQRRGITSGCSTNPAGYMRSLAEDGTVTCGTDSDTLGSLRCPPGAVPRAGGLLNWVCAPDDDTLGGLPCAPGEVAKRFEAEVNLGAIARWECAPDDDTLGDVDCSGGQLARKGNILVQEPTGGAMRWVCGEDADTLAALPCTPGQVAKMSVAGNWVCAAGDSTRIVTSTVPVMVLSHELGDISDITHGRVIINYGATRTAVQDFTAADSRVIRGEVCDNGGSDELGVFSLSLGGTHPRTFISPPFSVASGDRFVVCVNVAAAGDEVSVFSVSVQWS